MNNANEAAGASMAASGTVATGSGALHDLEHHGKLGIFRLVASVITLILGAGVFTLSGDQAAHGANGAAILTAWGISAVGVLCLVMTFFALSRLKPQLKGGIYSYAAAGFGDFLASTARGATGSPPSCAPSASPRSCAAPCRTSSPSSARATTWPPSSWQAASSGSTRSWSAAA